MPGKHVSMALRTRVAARGDATNCGDRSQAFPYRRPFRMISLIFARSSSMSASVGGSLEKGVSSVFTALVLLLVPAMAAACAALVTSPGGPCAPSVPERRHPAS